MRSFLLVAIALSLAAPILPAQQRPLEFDHLWIVVAPGAPERVALERAGLRVAPGINHHSGQGTSSVTVEFENAYLELIWVDSTVRVAPGLQILQDRFVRRAAWRTSAWSPIGIAVRRTAPGLPSLPFPTWTVRSEWMQPDDYLEMLTPRGDSLMTAWIVGVSDVSSVEGARAPANRVHPIGVRRVTQVRVTGPGATRGPANAYLDSVGVATFRDGLEWLVEVTFDEGELGEARDLRPVVPLLLRW